MQSNNRFKLQINPRRFLALDPNNWRKPGHSPCLFKPLLRKQIIKVIKRVREKAYQIQYLSKHKINTFQNHDVLNLLHTLIHPPPVSNRLESAESIYKTHVQWLTDTRRCHSIKTYLSMAIFNQPWFYKTQKCGKFCLLVTMATLAASCPFYWLFHPYLPNLCIPEFYCCWKWKWAEKYRLETTWIDQNHNRFGLFYFILYLNLVQETLEVSKTATKWGKKYQFLLPIV